MHLRLVWPAPPACQRCTLKATEIALGGVRTEVLATPAALSSATNLMLYQLGARRGRNGWVYQQYIPLKPQITHADKCDICGSHWKHSRKVSRLSSIFDPSVLGVDTFYEGKRLVGGNIAWIIF